MPSLKNYSTFHIECSAKEIITIHNTTEIIALIQEERFKKETTRLMLGGGSNIVFQQDFDGLVLHNN